MLPHPPSVVGLTICRDVVRERAGGPVSLIRSFSGMPVGEFPGVGEPFRVYAVLTDAEGTADAELVVTHFAEEAVAEVRHLRGSIRFADRLHLVECVFRFPAFVFPGPGVYLFTLLIDGGWTAQRALRVYRRGDQP